jgi:endonuclease/exonuclease/phosphatase family metal-dependent hydrolase
VRRGERENIPGYPDTPAILGELLGGEAVFGKAIEFGKGRAYGNALVSRYPILSAQTVPIPDPDPRTGTDYYETRCVIKATVNVCGTPVTVLSSHFGLNPDERENAADTVLRIAAQTDTPIVFMGDLNAEPQDPVIKRLSAVFTDAAAALGSEEDTFSSDDPHVRIDYIFLRGLTPLEIHTVKQIASDHFALTAEIKINN